MSGSTLNIWKVLICIFLSLIILIVNILLFFAETPRVYSLGEYENEGCTTLRGPKGAEDMDVFMDIVITGDDERVKLWEMPEYNSSSVASGSLWALHPPYKEKNLKKIPIANFPSNIAFHPHGLAVYKGLLFVINHAYSRGGERVEVLKLSVGDDKILRAEYSHSYVFENKYLGILNALTPISEKEFYVSLWRGIPDHVNGHQAGPFYNKILLLLGNLFKVPTTYILYAQRGQETHVKGEFIPKVTILNNTAHTMNNGLAWDGGDLIFTVHPTDGTSRIFRIQKDRSLHYERTIHLNCYPDNIRYDPKKEAFYIGCFFTTLDYLIGTHVAKSNQGTLPDTFRSLSGVDVIAHNPKNLDGIKAKNVYRSYKGVRLVSTATRANDFYFIGSWVDEGITVCPVTYS